MKKYLWAIRGYIIIGIVLNLVEAFLTSLFLLFPGWIVDNYHKGLSYIIYLTALYSGVFVLYLINAYFSNRVSDYRRIKFEKEIKKDFFNSTIGRDYESFHEYSNAGYISMQANDITEMCQNYLSPLLAIYRSILLILVFGISLVLFVNVWVALVILIFSILVVFVPRLTAKKLAQKNEVYYARLGNYTNVIKNFFDAHDILDSPSRKTITALHEDELDDVLNSNMSFRKTNSLAMVINGGAVEFVAVITFIVVALLLFHNQITVGMATISFTYSTRFIEPIYELNVCLGKVNSVRKVQKKLLGIINESKHQENKATKKIRTIETSALHKQYKHANIHLPSISLSFPKKYLIAGENGTGKSVLLRLLMNFEKPNHGAIRHGGEGNLDVSESVCYLPQKVVIFNGSYEDNVTIYQTYDSSRLELYESLFPKVIIQHIKENEDLHKLSGGEKQVIALLRGLCSNKDILLMDEPFAAMNTLTIEHFVKRMDQIDRMMVIVAHNMENYVDLFDEEIIVVR